MNKIITLILCLCCVFTAAWADDAPALNPSDANIVGHILDKKTGEHLSFINVFLKGTTIGTSTDATGHYYLKNLPEGKYTLVMKTLGFKTVEKPITLKKGKTLEINFEAEEDLVSLDGVVVSANRNETTRRLAPSLVNVLDSKTFETTHATSLADGLNFQPGVRVENNCQNCGFQQVRINGLEGPYTQILVDSRPIFSALTGCVRPRTDSGQYDRACRDHAWWRFRSFWFFGDCRYDQYHYKRAFAQLSPDCPFADDDRRKSPGQ